MSSLKQNQGFSLLELLVSIAVFLVISSLIYASYSMLIRVSGWENRKVELVQNGRVALDRMVRELRQCEEIVTSIPSTPDDPGNPPPSELLFQDGHMVTPIQYIRYYLSGTELHRELLHYAFAGEPDVWVYWNQVDEFGGSPEQVTDDDDLIAEFITDLQFWGDSRLLKISFKTSSQDIYIEFFTQIYGRNLP